MKFHFHGLSLYSVYSILTDDYQKLQKLAESVSIQSLVEVEKIDNYLDTQIDKNQ